jgi:hypothetical protein
MPALQQVIHRRRSPLAAAAAAPAAAPSGSAAKAGLIDGKKIAEDIRKEIAAEVQQLQAKAGRAPGLAVVLVGGRKDSETYVRSKKKACAEVGFESYGTDLPEEVSQEDLLQVVAAYNADPKVRRQVPTSHLQDVDGSSEACSERVFEFCINGPSAAVATQVCTLIGFVWDRSSGIFNCKAASW